MLHYVTAGINILSVGPFAKTAASAFAANILNARPREGVCTEMPLTRAAIKTAALGKGNNNDNSG